MKIEKMREEVQTLTSQMDLINEEIEILRANSKDIEKPYEISRGYLNEDNERDFFKGTIRLNDTQIDSIITDLPPERRKQGYLMLTSKSDFFAGGDLDTRYWKRMFDYTNDQAALIAATNKTSDEFNKLE